LTKDDIPSIVAAVIEALPNALSSTVTHRNSTVGQTLATVTTPDAVPQDQGTTTDSEQLQQTLGKFDTYCVSLVQWNICSSSPALTKIAL